MSEGIKIGKFRINRHESENNPVEVNRLLHGMTVVSDQYLDWDNSTGYVALYDGFDPIKGGDEFPEYEPIFNDRRVWAGFRRISP